MYQTFSGAFLVIAGIALVVFNKAASRIAIALQQLLSDRAYDETPFRLGYVLMGVSLCVTGALILTGHIPVR